MVQLVDALRAWPSARFARVLKQGLQGLQSGALPLEHATTQGGHVDDSDLSVTVLRTVENDHSVEAEVGVFFTEVVGGCNCHDDPLAVNAYCEMRVTIDKASAEAVFSLLAD
jgi:hypothetical protein